MLAAALQLHCSTHSAQLQQLFSCICHVACTHCVKATGSTSAVRCPPAPKAEFRQLFSQIRVGGNNHGVPWSTQTTALARRGPKSQADQQMSAGLFIANSRTRSARCNSRWPANVARFGLAKRCWPENSAPLAHVNLNLYAQHTS